MNGWLERIWRFLQDSLMMFQSCWPFKIELSSIESSCHSSILYPLILSELSSRHSHPVIHSSFILSQIEILSIQSHPVIHSSFILSQIEILSIQSRSVIHLSSSYSQSYHLYIVILSFILHPLIERVIIQTESSGRNQNHKF